MTQRAGGEGRMDPTRVQAGKRCEGGRNDSPEWGEGGIVCRGRGSTNRSAHPYESEARLELT
jgi:hypothetical protein